jgi:uncharacterized coiled-coil protein SlyX
MIPTKTYPLSVIIGEELTDKERISELEAQLKHCEGHSAELEAEVKQLRKAMDKYSEDEMLLIERCAKVCEVMGFKHSECPEMSEYCADAIRALAPRKESPEECPAICPNCVTPWKCNGPHIVERRIRGERRVHKGRTLMFVNPARRSGTDRRKK